jgi:hypothetical protein
MPAPVARAAALSLHMMQDCGLCIKTNASRAHGLLAGTVFLSMHMMHDGGCACSGSRDGIFVIAHDAAWWFVQHDQYFQNACSCHEDSSFVNAHDAGWLSV